LETLALQGRIVSMDAMGTQPSIAACIRDEKRRCAQRCARCCVCRGAPLCARTCLALPWARTWILLFRVALGRTAVRPYMDIVVSRFVCRSTAPSVCRGARRCARTCLALPCARPLSFLDALGRTAVRPYLVSPAVGPYHIVSLCVGAHGRAPLRQTRDGRHELFLSAPTASSKRAKPSRSKSCNSSC
jgi:hypothetical protein